MFKWFGNLIERLCGIAGAVVISQFPIFMQQYTHELSGHVAELQRHVAAMREVAVQGNKSLEAFIQKFVTSLDPDFRAQGELMHKMVQRWHQLSDGLTSIQHAALWERPYLFFKYMDSGVAHDTYRTFEPGLPLTIEGGLYAFLGLLLGTAMFRLIRAVLRSLIASLKPSQKPA